MNNLFIFHFVRFCVHFFPPLPWSNVLNENYTFSPTWVYLISCIECNVKQIFFLFITITVNSTFYLHNAHEKYNLLFAYLLIDKRMNSIYCTINKRCNNLCLLYIYFLFLFLWVFYWKSVFITDALVDMLKWSEYTHDIHLYNPISKRIINEASITWWSEVHESNKSNNSWDTSNSSNNNSISISRYCVNFGWKSSFNMKKKNCFIVGSSDWSASLQHKNCIWCASIMLFKRWNSEHNKKVSGFR